MPARGPVILQRARRWRACWLCRMVFSVVASMVNMAAGARVMTHSRASCPSMWRLLNVTDVIRGDMARIYMAAMMASSVMDLLKATMRRALSRMSSSAAAIWLTAAVGMPSEKNCMTGLRADVSSDDIPMPWAPRRMATNLPRTSEARSVTTCVPPKMAVPRSMWR